MAKVRETITLGIANEGTKNYGIDEVSTWEPKKVSYMGTLVMFQHDETFFTIPRNEFKEIFNK